MAFGDVLGDDRKTVRSRSGDSVKLVELLDEAIDHADAAIAEKNPDLDGDQRAEVAHMIGIGAVKYADLSTDRVKDYVFDLDRMVSFDGNTGPYLPVRARPDLLDLPSCGHRSGIGAWASRSRSTRRRSGRWRCDCSPIRRRSTRRSRPTVPTNCARTCTTWRPTSPRSTSTARCSRPTNPCRSSRLALADLTARTLAHALGLLGIDAPEQM